MSRLALYVFLSLAAVVQAATGDLKYVAINPEEGLEPNKLIATSRENSQFERDGSNRLVSFTAGSTTIKAALVYRSGTSKNPDSIAVDLSGEGKFKGVAPIPFKMLSDGSTFEAGPAPMKCTQDGKSYPVSVFVRYTGANSKSESVQIILGLGAEGQCTFGEKTYKIRLLDTSQNLKLGDAPCLPAGSRKTVQKAKPSLQQKPSAGTTVASDAPYDPHPGLAYGDTIIVQAGTRTVKGYYGQPLQVDGAWYDVKFDSAEGKVVAELNTGTEGGYIQVPHNNWSAVLLGQKYLLDLSGGKDKIAVPADHYTPISYTEHEGKAYFVCDGSSRTSTQGTPTFDVTANNTKELEIGSPLVGVPTINVSPKEITFNAFIQDSSGMTVDKIVLANGSRPSPPEILIKDEKGSPSHTGKLEYG